MMEVQQDFKELLKLFNENKVEYVVVGGYALAFHGAPRYTGDIDILINPKIENAKRILKVLKNFGFESIGLSVDDLAASGKVIQLGVPPVRVDLITSLTGVTWDQVFANKVKGDYGDIAVCYMGKEEFILNKKATGRHKDLADVEALGENTN